MYAIDNIVLQLFVQVWCDLVQTHCGLSMSLTQAQAGTRFLEGKKNKGSSAPVQGGEDV
jgi:hypothetical protein